MPTPTPSFPPRLPFGTLAIYPKAPRQTDAQKRAAAFIVSGVKRDAVMAKPPHTSYIQIAVDRLVQVLPGSVLEGFFPPDALLVPMPGSAALTKGNTVSSTRSIAKALLNAGLGANVLPAVRRATAIRKSAFCPPEERPTPYEHYETMEFQWPMLDPGPPVVILVDDVLTKGSTAVGAAARILERFPMTTIKVFALARSAHMNGDFYDPCTGLILASPNGASSTCRENVTAASLDSGRLF